MVRADGWYWVMVRNDRWYKEVLGGRRWRWVVSDGAGWCLMVVRANCARFRRVRTTCTDFSFEICELAELTRYRHLLSHCTQCCAVTAQLCKNKIAYTSWELLWFEILKTITSCTNQNLFHSCTTGCCTNQLSGSDFCSTWHCNPVGRINTVRFSRYSGEEQGPVERV